ncbi:MAG: acetoacetyl-CoA synthetase [Verrucomicrobiota bacterium]|jgi:acetoacetyl-CoA synthetase
MNPATPSDVLWQAPEALRLTSNLLRYQTWLAESSGRIFPTYDDLYRWSITDLGLFWRSIADFFEVKFHTEPDDLLVGNSPYGAKWFPGATLNYAERLVDGLKRTGSSPAILFRGESQSGFERQELTGTDVVKAVARAANALRAAGVRKGDRIAGFLSNRPETVIACLACASVGAIWSNSPPELASNGVVERLRQIEPKLLLATTGYYYGGKYFDRRETISEIVHQLPSLERVISIGAEREFDLSKLPIPAEDWADWLKVAEPEPAIVFEPVPFEHPLWILYSSGTTGIPKPIVHGHGGMLLEHLKALSLHLDLRKGDKYFWFTTAGWMMWNFLISGVALQTCIVLYDGSPKYPDLSVLWRFVDEEAIDYFGTSAPFLLACAKAGLRPGQQFKLSKLRGIGSTGAPLPPEGFDWVYQQVKPDVCLGSASGGTDACTAFILSNPWLPVRRGKLQCRGLGAKIEAWDDGGRSISDAVGELVITAPFPCLPVFFWNDHDGNRFRSSYFDHYPGIWRHGDWIEICGADGQCVIYGRSDSTLNRGGVRMGTSEFYRVVEAVPEIVESLVIDTTGYKVGESSCPDKLLLFVVLREAYQFDDSLRQKIKDRIRQDLSPRYVPDEIFAVTEIPHTLNGKKLEVPVKRLFQGLPLDRAVSKEAVGNFNAMQPFVELAQSFASGR